MRILIATLNLREPAGSETYAVTLANQLERLRHEVTVFALECGEMADEARAAGVRVACGEDALPEEVDAIVAQDGVMAYSLADRFRGTPQLFVLHTADFDLQRPPALPGVVSGAVVLNDRVAKLVGALAGVPPVHRLRQPVDVRRFVPSGPLPPTPRRLLILSNYVRGERRRLVESVAAELGIACNAVGGERSSLTPEHALNAADVVVGCGRSIVEAMACGRAAYVYGHIGGDGWVTPERYPRMEADGFSGLGFADPIDAERLRADLRAFDPAMGPVNRELALNHHRAGRHAGEIARLLAELAPSTVPEDAPLRELARMVRVQWNTDGRSGQLEVALQRQGARLREAEERCAALERQVLEAKNRAADAETRRASAERIAYGMAAGMSPPVGDATDTPPPPSAA